MTRRATTVSPIRRWAAISALATVLTAGGCGSDQPGAAPAIPESSAAAPTTSTPGTGSPGTGSPDDASTSSPIEASTTSPAVAPATGALMTTDLITMNSLYDDISDQTTTGGSGGTAASTGASPGQTVAITDLPLAQAQSGDVVDEMAADARTLDIDTPKLTRVADLVVAGQPAYHRSGRTDYLDGYRDEYGVQVDDQNWVQITFDTPRTMSQAERDARAASALATVQLR